MASFFINRLTHNRFPLYEIFDAKLHWKGHVPAVLTYSGRNLSNSNHFKGINAILSRNILFIKCYLGNKCPGKTGNLYQDFYFNSLY